MLFRSGTDPAQGLQRIRIDQESRGGPKGYDIGQGVEFLAEITGDSQSAGRAAVAGVADHGQQDADTGPGIEPVEGHDHTQDPEAEVP